MLAARSPARDDPRLRQALRAGVHLVQVPGRGLRGDGGADCGDAISLLACTVAVDAGVQCRTRSFQRDTHVESRLPHASVTLQDFQRTLPRLDMRFHELEKEEKEKEEAAAPNSSDTDDAGSTLDDGARKTLLWKILTDAQQQPTNTLVFANSIASADSLFDFLEAQVQRQRVAGAETASGPAFPACVLLFHKEVDRQQRQDVLAQLDDESANVVVVCTDIAARGLDTTKVRHVVQYEFANDVVSHLHRIGRTGRAGTAGRGAVCVCLRAVGGA